MYVYTMYKCQYSLTSKTCLPNKATCLDGKGAPLPLYLVDHIVSGRDYQYDDTILHHTHAHVNTPTHPVDEVLH